MAEKQQAQMRKGGKNMTTSPRRKERYLFYKANVYAKNKLKRILRSSGQAFAQVWARGHASESLLARMLK
jgi:hypothetical protein